MADSLPTPDPLPPPTDDPALRAALQRHFAHHRASNDLRTAVSALVANLDGTLGQLGTPRKFSRWRNPLTALAVLAILLSVGFLTASKISQHTQYTRYQLHKPQVARALATFDAREVPLFESFAVNRTAAELSAALSAALGREVVVPDAQMAGWTVTTAGLTQIDGIPVGYLYLRNQSRSAAMLNFAKSPSLGRGEVFDVRDGLHRIAGIATTDGLQVFVTAPCEPGADDDLSDLYAAVATALARTK